MQEQTENPTNSASAPLLSEVAAPAADNVPSSAAGVTAPEEGQTRRGRPRVFRNGAARQKAYRARVVTKKASRVVTKKKTAATRIQQLIAELKEFRQQESERLAAERAASIAAYERRLLAFRALNDLAESTAIRTRPPDFNSVVEGAEKLVPTWLVEEILCFPSARLHAPELVFLLCSNVELVKQLNSVPLQQAIRFLIRFDEAFQRGLQEAAARPFLEAANSLSSEYDENFEG